MLRLLVFCALSILLKIQSFKHLDLYMGMQCSMILHFRHSASLGIPSVESQKDIVICQYVSG